MLNVSRSFGGRYIGSAVRSVEDDVPCLSAISLNSVDQTAANLHSLPADRTQNQIRFEVCKKGVSEEGIRLNATSLLGEGHLKGRTLKVAFTPKPLMYRLCTVQNDCVNYFKVDF